MQEKDLYPTIFQRKSIRKYDLDPLNEDTLKEIRVHLQSLKPLHAYPIIGLPREFRRRFLNQNNPPRIDR